jgi:hypothetical protein
MLLICRRFPNFPVDGDLRTYLPALQKENVHQYTPAGYPPLLSKIAALIKITQSYRLLKRSY